MIQKIEKNRYNLTTSISISYNSYVLNIHIIACFSVVCVCICHSF